jgi:hypothetical protein
LLFAAAGRLKNKLIFPMIFLPSVAVLIHGAIFGPFTKFLIFFLPFIWISNWILITVFTHQKSNSQLFKIISSAAIKSLFLFIVANVFFSINLIPKMFLESMGLLQFVTAVIGGGVAYLVIKNDAVRHPEGMQ